MDADEPPSHPPPPPPSKKMQRPKITLQIPDANTPKPIRGPPTSSSIYWGPTKYYGKTPVVSVTPASRVSDPQAHHYFNPFEHMYHNKASEYMFKQFEGFKDFTMNTAKSGLSAGEKSAFWFYNRLKVLSKKWFTHLFLIVCLVLYSVIGAVIFMTLEGASENKYDKNITLVRLELFMKFQKLISNKSIDLDSLSILNVIEQNMINYENSYNEFKNHVVDTNTTHVTWSFWNSMFYAGTIYTTIGYGHISPKTRSGQVATIVYAIIGIPLFLLVLTDFGKLLTRIIKYFWAYIRRFYYTRSCRKVRRTAPMQEVMRGFNIVVDVVRRPSQIFNEEDIEDKTDDHNPPPIERKSSDVPPPLPPKPGAIRDPENETEPETPAPSVFEIDDEFNLPITLAIIILIIYLLIGAVIINIWEPWDFFQSFYFIFISISTIGLGDLVPKHPMYMMSSILYLVFGLSLTSMCINVVQLKLSDTFKQARVKLGATIGLQLAEDDSSLVPMSLPPVEIAPVHKPRTELLENQQKDNNDDDAKNA